MEPVTDLAEWRRRRASERAELHGSVPATSWGEDEWRDVFDARPGLATQILRGIGLGPDLAADAGESTCSS